jgi:hypothetical protein
MPENGVYNSATQTFVSGSEVPLQTDVNGNLKVSLTGSSGTSNVSIVSPVDGSGYVNVDVQTSALPTGAATSANQTNGTQQAKIADGTNVAGPMLVGDVNSLPTSQNAKESTYTLTGSSVTAPAVIGPGTSGSMTSIDTLGYTSVTIQVITFGTGVTSLNYQESGDNTNFISLGVYPWLSTSNVGTVQTLIDSNLKIFTTDIRSRYIRLTTNGNQTGSQTQVVVTLRTSSMARGSVMTITGSVTVLANAASTGTALASAARTATTTSAAITNNNFTKLRVYLNVTAASGTGGLQLQLLAKDPVTAAYNAMHSAQPAVPITAIGEYYFDYTPAAVAATGGASAAFSIFPPSSLETKIVHGDGTSYTYSVGYELIN